MQIPAGWNYLVTEGGLEHTTTAFCHTPEFTLQVTHSTRDCTIVQVREGWVEGFDFQNRDKLVDWGMHRSPADAFRFAEAYLADRGEDFRSEQPGRISPRYSRAVRAAY